MEALIEPDLGLKIVDKRGLLADRPAVPQLLRQGQYAATVGQVVEIFAEQPEFFEVRCPLAADTRGVAAEGCGGASAGTVASRSCVCFSANAPQRCTSLWRVEWLTGLWVQWAAT